MLFISDALANGAAYATPPSQASNIFLMIVIFLVFYIFLIRPHKKQLKEHQNKIASVKKGDVIVTSGGVMGKVIKLHDENIVHVKIAENTTIQIVKSTISDIVDKKFIPLGEGKAKDEKSPKTKKKVK